jgi:hypothetical protein
MRCAFALILLGGCHVVFGVDPSATEAPGDAAEDDGASIDAPSCSASTPHTMQVIEDTFILPDNTTCNPSIRFGTLPNLNLGQDDVSRVLLRFELPAELVSQLQANAALGDATLTLAVSDVAPSSGGIELEVYPLTNEWNEGLPATAYSGASWCNAVGTDSVTQTPWKLNGADGAADRGQDVLGTRPVLDPEATPGNLIDVRLPGSRIGAIRSWISQEKGYLSLIVIPTLPGTLFLQSREANDTPARLEIAVCDP